VSYHRGGEASRKKEKGLRHAWSRPAYHTSKDQNCFSLLHLAYDRQINYLPTCRRERSKNERYNGCKDVLYAVTIRIHTVVDTLCICYATGSRTLLIGEKDKEKKKRTRKTPRFRYVYIGLSVLLPAYIYIYLIY